MYIYTGARARVRVYRTPKIFVIVENSFLKYFSQTIERYDAKPFSIYRVRSSPLVTMNSIEINGLHLSSIIISRINRREETDSARLTLRRDTAWSDERRHRRRIVNRSWASTMVPNFLFLAPPFQERNCSVDSSRRAADDAFRALILYDAATQDRAKFIIPLRTSCFVLLDGTSRRILGSRGSANKREREREEE